MTTYTRVVIGGKDALAKTVVVAELTKTTNLSLPTPNTEGSHLLEDGTSQLMIRSRDSKQLKIAFTSGESGTKYVTINPGAVLSLEGIYFVSTTVYLQSPEVTTVEILELYT